MKKNILVLLSLCFSITLFAQADRWQQRAMYEMDINMDVETHRLQGTQRLIYINNSPDELDKVFYHLYFNAFQPGSMMDVRNQTLPDADSRVADRISKLKPEEIGYQKIKTLKMNGQTVGYKVVGTILEVKLSQPIPARGSAIFDMEFEAQVPVQIRRSGRNNKEGIDYSMAQWYPKMCEYDYQGWHKTRTKLVMVMRIKAWKLREVASKRPTLGISSHLMCTILCGVQTQIIPIQKCKPKMGQ